MTYINATIILLTLLLCGCNIQDSTSASLPVTVKPNSYSQIQHVFDQFDYNWTTLNQGVPDITIQHFPTDFGTIPNVKQKKQLFFLSLLPIVLDHNERVTEQRNKLKRLLTQYDQTQSLTPQDIMWINELTKEYRFKNNPLIDHEHRDQLLSRVDIIPTALVLAQAANESAYGSSRFAQKANNIFGEWTFTPGTGIIPKGRPAGKTYEVKKFASLSDSIQSYINNLNTHSAYSQLRTSRETMRKKQLPLEPLTLAEGLLNYSTRRNEYVSEIQAMISYNHLLQLSQLERRKKVTYVAASSTLNSGKRSSRKQLRIHDYL